MKAPKRKNTIYIATYVEGLRQPLGAIIEALHTQNKQSFAKSLEEIDELLKWFIEEIKE